jgi:thiamine-phosphate pyrophosphorylase
MAPPQLEGRLRAAIAGGVDLVQVRMKGASRLDLVAFVEAVARVTAPLGVPLLVNDDVEAAAQLGSAVAGVHLGQDDLPVEQARRRLGDRAWIGLSTHDAREVESGLRSSATHFGLGACFPTRTKSDTRALAPDELRRAVAASTRPLFAIGGITPSNVARLVALGVRRVAVASAILESDDPAAAAAAIRAALLAPA